MLSCGVFVIASVRERARSRVALWLRLSSVPHYRVSSSGRVAVSPSRRTTPSTSGVGHGVGSPSRFIDLIGRALRGSQVSAGTIVANRVRQPGLLGRSHFSGS